MRMDGGRGEMIGTTFPISLLILFIPSRLVVTGIHTISHSHLTVVSMATCSLFLNEPLKCVCVRLSGRG